MKNIKKKVIFINFWPTGAMKHYSDSICELLKENFDLFYFNNYNSKIRKTHNFKINNNILNLKNYFEIITLIKKINKISPDIIHINGSTCIPLLLIYPFIKKYNLIFTIHDPKSHLGEKLYKKIYQTIHFFIISKFVKKIIVHSKEDYSLLPSFLNKKNVFIVPPAKMVFSNKKNIFKKNNNSKFKVLFFGRIIKYKGLEYLVEAFKKLPAFDFQLTIAGKGKLPKNLIKQNNIKIFNYFVSDEELNTLFSETNIIVLPYLESTYPAVAYTAFAFQKPVIATDIAPLNKFVKNDFNGLLIKPKNEYEIRQAIKKIKEKKVYDKLVKNIILENEKINKNVKEKLFNAYMA
ncbi:MAG: glycosyltransferase family 4 protein [Candidatus Nanoarchaeia archaeon]|nr:glycosyltransferase family 4 protein [Candidatus Nanoarchaeia archaeon]